MSRKSAIAALFLGALFVFHIARIPRTHLVPDGYKGWVSVAYGIEGAPPLPVEDGHRVFRYDARGTLETSFEFEEGWGALTISTLPVSRVRSCDRGHPDSRGRSGAATPVAPR